MTSAKISTQKLFLTWLFLLVIGLTLVSGLSAASYNISTIAGNGLAAYNGDNQAATSAALNFNGMSGQEGFIFVDGSGNVYITDSGNNRIRKITASTGLISTIAGTGAMGYSGDGSAATSAMLQSPYGICLDSSGNVYFSDTVNNRIRKITMSSSLSTLASGLNNPFGVCTDSAGNVYFADTNNHRITRIDAITGIISSIAGNGAPGFSADGIPAVSAQLSSPRGIFFRNATNTIYVADTGNNRIRMFPLGGPISTVAGGGASTVGTSIPALTAVLNQPSGVCVNSLGVIYIADTGINKVRRVSIAGNIDTFASSGISLPQGVCVDSADFVYIANTGVNAVTKRNSSNSTIFTIATGLAQPSGVSVDSANNLYIANTGNNNIQRAAASDGSGLTTLVTGLTQPSGVCVDSSGGVYIADTQSNTIKKLASGSISTVAGTGAMGFAGDGGLATAAQIAAPTGVYTDSSNNIYFVDTQNQRVRKITASTGIISTIAGTGAPNYNGDNQPATSAALNFNGPRGTLGFVFVDSANNVYIADTANNRIRKITASTGIISTIAGTGALGFSGDGGPSTSAMLQGPYGVYVDGAGSIYLADTQNQRIRKLTAVPTTQTFAVAPGGGSQTLSGTYSTAYITGGGTAVLPPSNSISAVEVSNGILQVSSRAPITFNKASGGSAIVEILAAINTGAYTFATAGAVKIATGIAAILDTAPAGSSLMSKTGPGRLRAIANLSSSTTPVAISEGIFEVSGSGKLPNATTTISSGGTLQLGEASGSVAAGAVANASVASGGIMSILAGATDAVTSADISSGGIVSVAAGVTAPSGMFTSATFRSGGILQVGDGATLGQSFTSVA